MKDLGWTEARLAREVGLSQQHINRFLNRRQKLSPAASYRLIAALQVNKARLTPEAAGRIRAKASHLIEAAGVTEILPNFERLLSLRDAPRDPAGYEAWKARQIELLSAAEELEAARAWIKVMEARNADLEKERDHWKEVATLGKEIISSLEEINSNAKEVIALHKAWAGRLQRQLLEAGVAPTD